MTDLTKDFLGTGWKFPPAINVRGGIQLVSEEQDIEEAIKIILLTHKGERPLRPEFGSNLFLIEFQPNDMTTIGLARRYCNEALTRWEPRIEVVDVLPSYDRKSPEKLWIKIVYRVRQTNSERNLVFPYYTIPGEE